MGETTESLKEKAVKKDAINPPHYKQYPVEAIEMMLAIWPKEAVRDHCYMTAFKYRMRLGHKDAIQQEMDKEKWYLNKAAEIQEEIDAESRVRS